MDDLSLELRSPRPSVIVYRYSIVAMAVVLLSLGTSSLSAATQACANLMFSVKTSEPSMAAQICAVAAAAAERLAACHIPQRAAVRLHLVDRIVHSDLSLLGIYKRGETKLEVTSPVHFATLIASNHIYSRIPASELFESFIYHELTHALLDQGPGGSKQGYVNHEYMAYAMQMEALTPASRQMIIGAVGGYSQVSTEQLNGIVALADPITFAAWSWQHFSDPQNGCSFFQKLKSGEVSLELPNL